MRPKNCDYNKLIKCFDEIGINYKTCTWDTPDIPSGAIRVYYLERKSYQSGEWERDSLTFHFDVKGHYIACGELTDKQKEIL